MYDAVVPSMVKPVSRQALFGSWGSQGMPAQRTGNVQFVRKNSADAVGLEAADRVAAQLVSKPDSTLVFPTGNTPLPMYKALRHMPHLNWKQSRLFHLDEYVQPAGHGGPLKYETYQEYMRRELWDCLDAQKHYFAHYTAQPAQYEQLVNATGGPELVILGIGANGHIAFNEPGSAPDSPARTIDLTDQTVISNFGSVGKKDYPTQAVTLGLKTILGAKQILLLATGEGKREILKKALDPATPPDPAIPASYLKSHPNVTVITDFDV